MSNKISVLALAMTSALSVQAQEVDSLEVDLIDEVVFEGYKDKSTFVSKLPLKNIENPQVYSTVSANLLKQQVVVNYDDAMKNVPGVQQLWTSTGRGVSNGAFYSLRGFSVQPTMLNGLPGLTSGYPDPSNVERIEVIKGPSSTLYGSSLISYGGMINIITKKPKKKFGGNVSYTLGENALNRLAVDFNTPLDEAGKVRARVTGAFHTENSFQDQGFNRSYTFSPSVQYEVNDKLTLDLMLQMSDSKMTNPMMLFFDRKSPLTATNLDDLAYDKSKSYTTDDVTLENPTFNVQAQANYKLGDNWKSQTVLQTGSSKSKGYYSYLYEGTARVNASLEAQGLPNLTKGSVFARYISKQDSRHTTYDIQQNFVSDYKFGAVNNKLLVGVDFYQKNFSDNNSKYFQNGLIYFGQDDANYVNNVLTQTSAALNPTLFPIVGANGNLTKEGLAQIYDNAPGNGLENTNKVYSAYLSDIVKINNFISLSGGLRFDYFDSENNDNDQKTLSPKAGIVLNVIDNKLSLFGNYMNGFQNIGARQVSDSDGGNAKIIDFKPEQANQMEVGIKSSIFGGKMVSSLSAYQIKVSDKLMRDPQNALNYIQDGSVESKGVELDVRTVPFKGLDVILGYGYNDSKITNTDNKNTLNTRPLDAGAEHTANFWVNYKIQNESLKGLGFGIGGNYTSEYAFINYHSTGDLIAPSVFVLSAVANYEFSKFNLALKVDNLSNKEYYRGWTTITPQMPRRVLGTFTYKF